MSRARTQRLEIEAIGFPGRHALARDYVSSSIASLSALATFYGRASLAGIEPVGFRVKSDLRNHQAIVQPRLYDSLMVTPQITLKTEVPEEDTRILLAARARAAATMSAWCAIGTVPTDGPPCRRQRRRQLPGCPASAQRATLRTPTFQLPSVVRRTVGSQDRCVRPPAKARRKDARHPGREWTAGRKDLRQ